MSYLDWEQEKEEQTDITTEETIQAHRDLVIEYLKENGHRGYALGKGKATFMRVFHICVLDPEDDKPKEILLFVDPVVDINRGVISLPIPTDPIEKDDCSTNIVLKVSEIGTKDLSIETDRSGNILEIE